MSDATLKRHVETFLGVVGRYWEHTQLCNLWLSTAGVEPGECPPRFPAGLLNGQDSEGARALAEAVRHQGRQSSARKAILKVGPRLACELEAENFDSRAVLKFVHAVDRGGGPRVAAPLWPELKVELQRVAIRAAILKAPIAETLPCEQQDNSPRPIKGEERIDSAVDDHLSGEAKALATLVQHPEWSDKDIADHVGCSRASLYRWTKYRAAREALKAGRQRLPKADEI